MNNEWRSFLESQSGTIAEDERVSFPEPDNEHDCRLCDLSFLGLLEVSGGDAESFLQGQLTNDLRRVLPDAHQMNSYCSPKGRMLANFRVFREDGGAYVLQMPKERVQPTLQRLGMFVLRAQVRLRDVSDDLVRVGLVGDCAPTLIAKLAPGLGTHPGAAIHAADLTILRLPGESPRFEIIGPLPSLQPFWEQWSRIAPPASSTCWEWHEIRAGIPTVFDKTAEAFVPQMANMQLVDGVSFSKGCYTGQEIVARMQYLGKLKRRMYLAHVECKTRPIPGDPLFSPSSQSGQGDGNIVDAQPSPGGGFDLLAVIPIDSVEANDVRVGSADGPLLQFHDLPYSFDAADAQMPGSG
jgi:folate-binding protein YgfZ